MHVRVREGGSEIRHDSIVSTVALMMLILCFLNPFIDWLCRPTGMLSDFLSPSLYALQRRWGRRIGPAEGWQQVEAL